jgi:uncharacterized membrane protein YedE/YeeE
MAMNTPLFQYGLFGDNISLIVAFIIGIGFGFALERAGFGSARKLTAQFYLTDMSVFKVMFTAIITAMLGIFYLSWFGILDISLVYVSPTYLVPQIVGGLILGVGFTIGGYCPGTSCVAVSSGKYDGIIYLLGVMFGIFVFGMVFPFIESFFYSTPMGKITLPQILNLSYGFVVFLVVLMAVGGFVGATWVEKKMAERKGAAS